MNFRQCSRLRRISALAICGAIAAFAQETQTMPPVVLRIDTANFVRYDQDTTDWTKLASVSGIANPLPFPAPPFASYIVIGDVVAVNGRPAKGVRIMRPLNVALSRNVAPKQATADLAGSPYLDAFFVIQNPDGTVIGTLAVTGLQISDPIPAARGMSGWGNVVTGGTGAFLGVTGQGCAANGGGTPPGGVRRSSVTEDPANRRINGGGSTYSVFCLIPRSRPQVILGSDGPLIVHADDHSQVTETKPASAGEILTLLATGLGPTLPGVDPGQPFTADPLQLVSSPIDVTINGAASEVLYTGGYQGTTDKYQVNFRVPDNTSSGMASLQLFAAWIPGPEVKIAIR